MTFAFYDLETTGTSPAFDQPLQFAAILTDSDLQEIEQVNLPRSTTLCDGDRRHLP